MKTNQLTLTANQPQNNDETILSTLDNTDLEKLSGGAVYLKFEGIKGESASADTAPSGEGVAIIRYRGI
ncbi:MAG: hypothetical protein F6J95_019945 [Leptolyngbya sp. SIO1E4]|nr:hypothetical protein [Leptolyngbya sp. SIO1E4]